MIILVSQKAFNSYNFLFLPQLKTITIVFDTLLYPNLQIVIFFCFINLIFINNSTKTNFIIIFVIKLQSNQLIVIWIHINLSNRLFILVKLQRIYHIFFIYFKRRLFLVLIFENPQCAIVITINLAYKQII